MIEEPQHRAIMSVDIARSAGRGNMPLLAIREALAEAMAGSFAATGIDWDACRRDDLGDGMRLVLPSGIQKRRLIYPLMRELSDRVRSHNQLAAEPAQIRLRVALHAGEVYLDHRGAVAGGPLEVLARMLDAVPLRGALAAAPEAVPVALMISQHIYDETVGHGYAGIEPDMFGKVSFTTKEYTAQAWVHLPGHRLAGDVIAGPADPHPAPHPLPVPPRDAVPAAPMVNTATGNGVVFAVQHGVQQVNQIPRP
jgi:hypothetical protein